MNALDHARALVALLEDSADGEAPGQPADAFTAQARAGVPIDALALAELVAAAQALGLTPSTTLRAALRALREQVGRQQRRSPVGRLVGKDRALLAAKK